MPVCKLPCKIGLLLCLLYKKNFRLFGYMRSFEVISRYFWDACIKEKHCDILTLDQFSHVGAGGECKILDWFCYLLIVTLS
jgi:hypothetical protein